MTKRILIILTVILTFIGSNGCDGVKGRNAAENPIHINRFDKDLYQLLLKDDAGLQQRMVIESGAMLKVFGLGLFKTSNTPGYAFFDRVVNYYSEPTLNELYRDALAKYETIDVIEDELSLGFQYLHKQLPSMQIPAVYMHVSGLQQNVLIADSLLSISIDKYMGADYPLYQDFFYSYQRQKMTSDRIVPDYLMAWLLSEYPFKGNERVLLERMIYEGKIKYILHQALPEVLPETLMGYTPKEYKWCAQNEKLLWRYIIENKHLYTPDILTVTKYFSGVPQTFIADDAPGDLGSWIGWQIVSKYMDNTKVTVESLIKKDYMEILSKSKYKP